MPRDPKFLYTIFTKNSVRGEILLGHVSAINPDDAILEFVTRYSTDPLDRGYANKREASRHLGFFREMYGAEMARKNGDRQGRPLRVNG